MTFREFAYNTMRKFHGEEVIVQGRTIEEVLFCIKKLADQPHATDMEQATMLVYLVSETTMKMQNHPYSKQWNAFLKKNGLVPIPDSALDHIVPSLAAGTQ